MSNAIQTKDNEANHLIIYCLNCIRHGRNATYEPGLTQAILDAIFVEISTAIFVQLAAIFVPYRDKMNARCLVLCMSYEMDGHGNVESSKYLAISR